MKITNLRFKGEIFRQEIKSIMTWNASIILGLEKLNIRVDKRSATIINKSICISFILPINIWNNKTSVSNGTKNCAEEKSSL
jgi:hypothetical protein